MAAASSPPSTLITVKAATTILLGAAVAMLAACGGGSDAERTPTACLAPAGSYLRALEANPTDAKLEGDVALSDCLIPDQQAGDLSRVGTAVVEAATKLNAEANEDPGGESALQLGYLVGSVEEAASGTAGIHTDLVRRLSSAARAGGGRAARPPSSSGPSARATRRRAQPVDES